METSLNSGHPKLAVVVGQPRYLRSSCQYCREKGLLVEQLKSGVPPVLTVLNENTCQRVEKNTAEKIKRIKQLETRVKPKRKA